MSYRGGSVQPVRHVTQSAYSRSLDFVRSEFFSLAGTRYAKFCNFYGRKYGGGAEDYLRQTRYSWQSGTTGMSGQTMARILSCVPPFLDVPKQFELLSFQVPSVLQQQREKLKLHGFKLSEMEKTYRAVAEGVVGRDYKLSWFINDVFPATECDEFKNVFKYTIMDQLRRSYSWVREDIAMLHGCVSEIEGSIDVVYHVAVFDCPMELDMFPPVGAAKLDIAFATPNLVTEFGEYYRKILLEHALVQIKAEQETHAVRQIALDDVRSLVSQLATTRSDQEYDLRVEIVGHGGTAQVRLQKKNLLRLRSAVAVYTFWLLLTCGLLCVSILLACTKGWWLLVYPGWIVFAGAISAVWRKLHGLRKEISDYERKRTRAATG